MPKQVCKDFNKKVASGYPITIYHATVDKDSVCEGGLKPSCEVKERASGLGQITCDENKTISFTVDKQIGIDIAKDLKTLIKIANGSVNIHNIKHEIDTIDDEGLLLTDAQNWMEVPYKTDPKGDYRSVQFQESKDKVLFLKLDPNKKYYKEIERKPSAIWDEGIETLPTSGKESYFEPIYSKNEKERVQGLYDLWSRRYLPLREKYGGRHDPWFAVSARPYTLKDFKASDVGLFQVKAFLQDDCFEYSDRSHYHCVNTEWKENDFEITPIRQIRGEFLNREIRVPRERFTELQPITIPRKKIPKNAILLPRIGKIISS